MTKKKKFEAFSSVDTVTHAGKTIMSISPGSPSSSTTYYMNVSARKSRRRALAEFILVAAADRKLEDHRHAYWRVQV